MRDAVTGDSRSPCLVFEQLTEALAQSAVVARINAQGDVCTDLRQGRHIRGQYRHATDHRFEHGQAEPFVE